MNPRDVRAGQRVGRWVVIGPGRRKRHHTGAGPWFRCRCDCGVERSVWGHSLVAKRPTTSCGCYQREAAAVQARQTFTTHGQARRSIGATKEYKTWCGIIRRCLNSAESNYPRYGGRGVRICAAWRQSFETFLADVGPAPSPAHSIDRIDNTGHYEPGNVRWATRTEQVRNSRAVRWITAFGRRQTLGDWAAETGIKRQTIQARLDLRRWPVERALTH